MRSSFELGLLTTLGGAYASTDGIRRARNRANVFARATELSDELGDVPELFWAIRGVWSAVLVRGDLVRVHWKSGSAYLRAAEASGKRRAANGSALHCWCDAHVHGQHVSLARPNILQASSILIMPTVTRQAVLYTAVDVVAVSMALGAQTAWLLGLDDEADIA